MRYTVSETTGAAFERWGPRSTRDAGMVALAAAVAAALDRGVFYSKQMRAEITPLFDLTEEEISRGIDRVEGGVWGMEIYYARRAVEAERAAKAEAEARERLALKVGDNLGELILVVRYKRRRLRRCVVAEIGGEGYALQASCGNQRWTIKPVTGLAIENAKRKSTRDPFYTLELGAVRVG